MRKRGNPDRGSHMAACLTEDTVKDAACTIDHLRLLCEIGAARNKASDAQKLLDSVEIAQRQLEHREGVQRAHAGRLDSLLDRHGFAEDSRANDPPIYAWELPRDVGDAVVNHDRQQGGMRQMRTVQGKPKLRDASVTPGFIAAWLLSRVGGKASHGRTSSCSRRGAASITALRGNVRSLGSLVYRA